MSIPDNTEPILEGILLIDKPEGPTSMRAVERVRRAAGGVRCGHAGTLDPLATGVLIIAVGSATRSINMLMDLEKQYETTIDLSATTPTLQIVTFRN
jgi:tRNA pseudouridine55 synthase